MAPTETHDVVIVGSGFGGSIHAARLAEAGRSVLVIERGRRYAPSEFPRDVRDTDALLWRHPAVVKATGLFDFRVFSGISTVVAAGVGGGSLIYASIHYRPRPEVFEDPRWPAGFDRDALEPYYAKVERALGVQAVPTALGLAKRDSFVAAGAAMGRRVMDTPQAVSWKEVFGSGDGRTTCRLCCECEFGCTFGAKNTLDFTYLARAEALGAEVRPGHLVSHIAPAPDGGWEVHYSDTATRMSGKVVGRRVVVAAGTLGTNEILLRSRDGARTLPKLSHRLGFGYSGNGDFLGNVQNADVLLEPWNGPDVTSVMWYDDRNPAFVLAAPTFNRAVMEVLASFGQRRLGRVGKAIAPLLWNRLPGLASFAFRRGLLSKPLRRPGPGAGPPERMTNLFAIGVDNAGGRLTLRGGQLDILWDYERENRELIERQRAAMQDIAGEYGGTYADFPLWEPFRRTMTVHSLGGCALSTGPDTGVVDVDGQVHGHRGLYVADGSVIPTAIGSHPAMTISALAERIAEPVVASFD
jgi:cholesterol oxidase